MRILGAVILLIFCNTLNAQNSSFIDSLLNNRLVLLHQYHQPVIGNKSFFLKMDFGRADLLDTTGIYEITGKEILSVDLLFTDYPSSQTLKSLNKKRFQNLIKVCPYLLNYKYAQWQVVRQMDGKDKKTAENMLHGFVINYRAFPTKMQQQKELQIIESFDKLIQSQTSVVTQASPVKQHQKINYWEIIHGGALESPRFYNNLPVKDISDKSLHKSERTDTIIKFSTSYLIKIALLNKSEIQKFNGRTDSLYVLLSNPKQDNTATKNLDGKEVPEVPLSDSSLLKILNRNSFKNTLIVTDVTLSMAEYTVQVLNWLLHTLHKKNTIMFTCFNDGDDIANDLKKINATGGVYGTTVTNIHDINLLVENVMQKGSGGDTPENVCEAIIKSIAMCNNCDDVILIADNWAAVRDIALLNQIHKPIHIFICGGETGTHKDYINIAYQTKGSLHFEKEDILDLSHLQNGMLIRGVAYKLDANGNVDRMKN